MKFAGLAGALGSALSAAALALDDKSNIEALRMVRIDVKDDHVEFTVDALDRRVITRAPVSVIEAGAATGRCASISGVLTKLRPDQTVRLARVDNDVTITAGRSRFRVPGLALDMLPQSAVLTTAAAEFSLDAEDAARLIEATAYAASTEETRYYLNGIYLHTVGAMLRATATDGYRLAQFELPLPAGAKNLPSITIPNKTIAILAKLLKRTGLDGVTFKASDKLLEVRIPNLELTSKLIDESFPDYQYIIPTDQLLRHCRSRRPGRGDRARRSDDRSGVKGPAAYAWIDLGRW